MLLKFLRKRKNMKRIMWGLAILIIPAFVIWGSGTSAKNKGARPDYAGKIFNKKISYEEYLDMWNVVRDYAIKSFGNNIPQELIDELAWNRIILLEEAKRKNVTVKDSEVIEKIASFPVFQTRGSFDKKLYKSMLGDSARGFEEKLRDDMIISKMKENITKDITVSDDEVKEHYKKQFEKIKLSYIVIPFSDSSKDVRYEEPDLLIFYEAHKEYFKKDVQANVKYIEIPFSKFDEEFAYKLLDEVISKKNLEEPARLNNLEVRETGLFTNSQEIPDIGRSYDFIKSSFELSPKEICSMLIKTDKGFYIIQLKELKEPYIPAFIDAKDSVKDAYIKNNSIILSEKKSIKLLSDIEGDIKNGDSFENAAKKYGLETRQTDYTARDEYIAELGPAQDIVESAFSIKDRIVAGPVKTLNGWVIIKPVEYQGIDEAKFLQEKDQYKAELLSRKKQEIFDRWFEGLKNKSQFVSFTNIKN